MASKKEIANGVAKFISNDILNDVGDKHLRFVLCMAKEALQNNPDVIDRFLGSPLVANVLKNEDDDYDVDSFARTLRNVLSAYDSFSISVPAVPVFAPKENSLKITASDIDRLLEYIHSEPVQEAVG